MLILNLKTSLLFWLITGNKFLLTLLGLNHLKFYKFALNFFSVKYVILLSLFYIVETSLMSVFMNKVFYAQLIIMSCKTFVSHIHLQAWNRKDTILTRTKVV